MSTTVMDLIFLGAVALVVFSYVAIPHGILWWLNRREKKRNAPI